MSKTQLLLLSLLPAVAAAGLLIELALGMRASTLMLWGLWGASIIGCLGMLAVPVGILAFYRPAESAVSEPEAQSNTEVDDSAESPADVIEDADDVADFDDDEDFQDLADNEFSDEDLSDFDDEAVT